MNQPLRILACNWRCLRHPQAGGAEANLFEQARRWARDGHSVTVFTADPGRRYAPDQDETVDGVEVRRVGGRFTVYLAALLFVLLHSREFDVILDVANGLPFFTQLVSRRPVTLLVHHVHDGQWFSEFPWPIAVVGRFIERHIVPWVYRNNAIIAVSPTTRDALVDSGVAAEQIRVVYNGVVGPSLPPPAPESRDQDRIVYVGRLKRYKRLERLVRSVASLRAEFPSIHLDVAGDGDGREDLLTIVDELGLRSHVTLHGFVDETAKAELLRSAALFATPSKYEGWGLSVIEANAQGCPAVAYDVPGLRSAIRHGQTGLLAADDGAFTSAIGLLLRDHDLRARCAASAVVWAARFDWDQCAAQTLAILTSSGAFAADEPALEAASA